jgi:hypothetical protein
MVVTSARGAQADGRRGNELRAGEDAQAFQRAGNARAFQAVITMFSLNEYFDQVFRSEAGEMGAGGGRADAGDDGELCAGAGVAVHERVENAGAGGLANGGGEARNCEIDIHSSMVNEVWMWDKRHTAQLREGSGYENYLFYPLRDRSVSKRRV